MGFVALRKAFRNRIQHGAIEVQHRRNRRFVPVAVLPQFSRVFRYQTEAVVGKLDPIGELMIIWDLGSLWTHPLPEHKIANRLRVWKGTALAVKRVQGKFPLNPAINVVGSDCGTLHMNRR